MNNLSITRIPAALGAIGLLASAAQAQTITPLVEEGDVLSMGTVTSIYNMDVNDLGQWLVELDTDNADSKLDNATLLNGTEIYAEGTNLGIPASHAANWVYDSYIDTLDINDNGDYMVLMNAEDVGGTLPDTKLLIWTSGMSGTSYVLMEQGATPNTVAGEPAGAVWDSIAEVWQNNNNELIVAGRSSSDDDDMLVRIDHDGAGNITSQTLFAIDNVIHNVAFPPSDGVHADTVQGFTVSKQNIAFNNAGEKFFYVDDQSYGSGGTVDYTDVDSHYYIDTTEVAWEFDTAPTPDGPYPFNHLSSAEVDINDAGDWVAIWDDDGPTDRDFFLCYNGTVLQQEGSPPPGIGGGFVITGSSWGHVQISDFGDIMWMCDWDDANTDIDSGLYRNDDLLVQEGVSDIGGVLIDTISSSADGSATSDNGQYHVHEFTLADGVEGAYLIEFDIYPTLCPGDGSGTACPCGNNNDGTVEDAGCANGQYTSGALLTASGTSSLSNDTLVLHGSYTEHNQFGLYFQANNNLTPGQIWGDGLRCAGGELKRLGTVNSDGTGSSDTTGYGYTISSKAGNIAPGDTKFYQLWYRNPLGSPCAADFNASNGVEVTWIP